MDRKSGNGTAHSQNKKKSFGNAEIIGIMLIAGAVFMFCSLLGFNVGSIGTFVAKVLSYALGRAAYLLPLYLMVIGMGYVLKHESLIMGKKFFSIILLLVSLIGLLHNFLIPIGQEILPESLPKGGGLLGGALLLILRKFVGQVGAIIVLIAGVLAGAVMTSRFSISSSVKRAGDGVKNASERIEIIRQRRRERAQAEQENEKEQTVFLPQPPVQVPKCRIQYPLPQVGKKEETAEDIKPSEPMVVEQESEKKSQEMTEAVTIPVAEDGTTYRFPPFSLLDPPHRLKKNSYAEDISAQSQVIEQTLNDFNVRASIVNVTKGPSVTRFELAPAPGVKVSKIQGLSDDLALQLAAPAVRIEPIPGKTAIGLEVPSIASEAVNFRAVVDCDSIKKAGSKLCVGLGKDISGNVIVADLGKMPHLLIAGSTGSGKSVCINTIIASLLYRATPDEVKLILVDPKVVELTNYNGIPHLLTPVVTKAKQAASALHWAVVEMERRYSLFAQTQVREINRYNEISVEKLPFIVIIIDELADLMMVAAVDVEDAILRLAQKARAAGIHLILATQRPSVDVITGIIKANIPSRIAFAVSSQIDSRTILDMNGAEKLLGKGDMLFYPIGANKPLRIQGAFISDDELAKVVDYIKKQAIPTEFEEQVTTQELNGSKKSAQTSTVEPLEDELFEDAVRLVMATQQASSSMLQRKFRIGYTRAARLVDTMEEKGIVGPADGSKPRDLIMSPVEIEETFFTKK